MRSSEFKLHLKYESSFHACKLLFQRASCSYAQLLSRHEISPFDQWRVIADEVFSIFDFFFSNKHNFLQAMKHQGNTNDK